MEAECWSKRLTTRIAKRISGKTWKKSIRKLFNSNEDKTQRDSWNHILYSQEQRPLWFTLGFVASPWILNRISEGIDCYK